MNNCADTLSRYAKAYSADYWSKIAEIMNRCDTSEKETLKSNINEQINIIKQLLNQNK